MPVVTTAVVGRKTMANGINNSSINFGRKVNSICSIALIFATAAFLAIASQQGG